MQLEQSRLSLTKIPQYGNKSNVPCTRVIFKFSEFYHKGTDAAIKPFPFPGDYVQEFGKIMLCFLSQAVYFFSIFKGM